MGGCDSDAVNILCNTNTLTSSNNSHLTNGTTSSLAVSNSNMLIASKLSSTHVSAHKPLSTKSPSLAFSHQSSLGVPPPPQTQAYRFTTTPTNTPLATTPLHGAYQNKITTFPFFNCNMPTITQNRLNPSVNRSTLPFLATNQTHLMIDDTVCDVAI